ncbi:hypothetical protein [Thermococcus sp. Bubb.Bath]|uniref:hypothetical protein n=1 Tax=Thermococcus sp. Bubb.Bath TaxID=1638242 RepID=UPI00143B8B52|nr:hypothetical protein [Thermococcus sp. Bubb.Bath]
MESMKSTPGTELKNRGREVSLFIQLRHNSVLMFLGMLSLVGYYAITIEFYESKESDA